MTIPSTATQLLVTLVLIVPGFVYQAVRIRISGRTPGDTELPARIMQAIVTSTVFALVYVVVLGPVVVDAAHGTKNVLEHPRGSALLGFAAAFVIPAATAAAAVWFRNTRTWRNTAEKARPANWGRVDLRPSAWDVAFEGIAPCFVRVRLQDGTWFAGWFGQSSYASSWPDPRDLYVEISYQIDETGKILEAVEGSTGAVIDCTSAVLIELLQPDTDADAAPSGTIETTAAPEEAH